MGAGRRIWVTFARRTHCRCDPVHSRRSVKRFLVTCKAVGWKTKRDSTSSVGRWRSSRGALLRTKTTLSYTWRSKRRFALLSYFFLRLSFFFLSSTYLLIRRPDPSLCYYYYDYYLHERSAQKLKRNLRSIY